jgi:hypothetical protein
MSAELPARAAMRMKKTGSGGLLFGILLLSISNSALADAYVDPDLPFLEIRDSKQQAEAWAVCAASYDIMSTIMEPQAPQRAGQLSGLGDGAELAVAMALIINDLDPDIPLQRFKTLWANAAVAMTELPQAKLTSILADAEKLGAERAQEFGRKINATVVACINNLEAQRMYIASWRELVNSGLLKPPAD